jgi:hypothetical protein
MYIYAPKSLTSWLAAIVNKSPFQHYKGVLGTRDSPPSCSLKPLNAGFSSGGCKIEKEVAVIYIRDITFKL